MTVKPNIDTDGVNILLENWFEKNKIVKGEE